MKFGRERTTIRKDGVEVGNRKHLNFVGPGATVTDDGASDEVDVTISGGGGGGGAPFDASYVVFGAHVDLTNEKLLGADTIMSGTEAARPAAATAGRLYFATDTLRLFRDTGAAWTLISVQTLSEMAGVLTDGQIPASITRDAELHTEDHDHDGTPTQKLLAANTHESPSANTHHNQSHGETDHVDPNPLCATFGKEGVVAVVAGTLRFYVKGAWTITQVRASVGTAPTGASLIVDVNKNGTTVFTTQSNRPTIAASGFTDLADAINVTALADGDYLTVDVDQIGSSVAGSNLTVQVWMVRA